MPISIFPFFLLLVGVAWCFPRIFPQYPHGDDGGFQPIMGRSSERRICVELCMSGFGGEPCGDDCVDISPFSRPIKSDLYGDVTTEKNETLVGKPRTESCPVLCANNLGYPLCSCSNKVGNEARNEVDYVEICGHFCISYNYQIFGCQSCEIYRNLSKSMPNFIKLNEASTLLSVTLNPYWTQWCVEKCADGEGGSACNCDKPVMATLT